MELPSIFIFSTVRNKGSRSNISQPISLPLAADDILEFHAARLLLLLEICGTAGRIDGLTKMAKLDFFKRYLDFLAALAMVFRRFD